MSIVGPSYLLLAPAEFATIIPNVGVVAFREFHDEVVCICLVSEAAMKKSIETAVGMVIRPFSH